MIIINIKTFWTLYSHSIDIMIYSIILENLNAIITTGAAKALFIDN